MSAAWEVAQLVFAVVGILTCVAFVTLLAILAADRPTPADEWDGTNDPLDDGSWTVGDSELAQEAHRFKRGNVE